MEFVLFVRPARALAAQKGQIRDEMFDNDLSRGAMRDDYSKGGTKLTYSGASDQWDNFGNRTIELARDHGG